MFLQRLVIRSKKLKSQFRALGRYDVGHMLVRDDLTGRQDCLLTNSKIGCASRAFFPNIGKTKNNGSEGYSQWDFFTVPNLFERFLRKVRRHFKQDGFYVFSRPVYWITPGCEWLELRERWLARGNQSNKDFWLQPLKAKTIDPSTSGPSTISRQERRQTGAAHIHRLKERARCASEASHNSKALPKLYRI